MKGREDIMTQHELMASKVHDIWCNWISYVLSCGIDHGGAVIIPKMLVERWTRQLNTPYEELPEKEKYSDKVIAEEILRLAKETT